MKSVYVKIFSATRLGNWMFQYAAAKSRVGIERRVAFVVPNERKRREVEKFAELYPDVAIVDEAPDDAMALEGFFQDEREFDQEVVKTLFPCPPRIERLIDEKYGTLFRKPNLVSIHVRRGDYLKLPHRHPFVGKRYLREAVSRFPEGEFIVCSDDIPWCKKFFKGDRFNFMEGNEVLVDLFLAAKCPNHICSNSTFSWWGAYLNRSGRTIFPSMWYGIDLRDADWQGLYFKGSEVISNRYSSIQFAQAWFYHIKTMCGNCLRRFGLRR